MKICFVCFDNVKANKTKNKLVKLYGNSTVEKCNFIVALGGDGFLLKTIHDYNKFNLPIYGMNLGTIGFLMNKYDEKNLLKNLQEAQKVKIKPLKMKAINQNNSNFKSLAFNEVSIIRNTYQAAKLSIKINGIVRMKELICDGVLVSTPAGSTAYNLSAHGPIIPLGTNALALTPISPFRPRRWRGALIPESTAISIEAIDSINRPISVAADHNESQNIKSVIIKVAKSISQTLLFNSNHSFDERILKEQFIE